VPTHPLRRAFRVSPRRLACATALVSALLAFSASPTLAATTPATQCSGQTFSQPFTSFGDLSYYTLLPGSDFNSWGSGWQLRGGAGVVTTKRADGSIGNVLNLPSGSRAVSPPLCVTLDYQTARTWVHNVVGSEGVTVSVSYAGTSTACNPQSIGVVTGQQSNWALSNSLNIHPEIAGTAAGTREVRFTFVAGGRVSDFQIWDFWVDPRMNK
jgi:hypothetical protein